MLGEVTFAKWDGKNPYYSVDAKFQAWINPVGIIVTSPYGKALETGSQNSKLAAAVDVNVSRGGNKAGLKLYHISMCDNALSIALWFKTDEKSGMLFGKDGYNAFGKAYRTISCSIDNERILANPGHLAGGRIEPSAWQFVVLTADEGKMCLYLNGEMIATGPGTKDITTDAMDFFQGCQGAMARLQLFNSPLNGQEVKNLYNLRKIK